jgi:hypothetical protein
MANLVGGTIFVRVNGKQLKAKGAFTINLGFSKNEMVLGHDGVHGPKSMPQIAKIEGAITHDSTNFPLSELAAIANATVTVELADGRVATLREAWQTAELDLSTEEGEITVSFEGVGADLA